MTAEEKAALEWLRVAFAAEGTSRCHWFPDANDMKQAATLKAMLAPYAHPTAPLTLEEEVRRHGT